MASKTFTLRDPGRYMRRRVINYAALTLSVGAMLFGLIWLAWILWSVVWSGISGLTFTALTHMTPPPMDDTGGLANAIFGSFAMVAVATLIGTPVGLLAGIALAEYTPSSRFAKAFTAAARFINDILLSAPSIIIGLFVFGVAVEPFGTFSGWAGSLALSLMVVPVVVRATENMLLLIPASLREAAHALGTPRWRVVLQVSLRAARAGVITGVLLAVARIAGETAPLLFTALNNQFWSVRLSGPMSSLAAVIYKFAFSPYENWQRLAWAGVLIITLAVLVLNIVARWVARERR
jgi:phosphate transport system permease protein